MQLDARGKVSVVELLFYLPLQPFTIYMLYRHGLKRVAWIYLMLLSTMRIIGAVTHIASEQAEKPNVTLHTVFGIMEASGVSPLLLATLAFLGIVMQHIFEDVPYIHFLRKWASITAHGALGLTIAGGVMLSGNNHSNTNTAITLRHIGVIMFIGVFNTVVLVTTFNWMNKRRIMKHRQALLVAITATIPFLAIRVLYTVLSAFAPTGIPGVTSGNANLSAFNSTTGSVAAYVLMSVIMEMNTVAIYAVAGLVIPLDKDYPSVAADQWTAMDDREGRKFDTRMDNM